SLVLSFTLRPPPRPPPFPYTTLFRSDVRLARTNPRRSAQPGQRHLQSRVGAVRDAGRPAPVPGRSAGDPDHEAPERAPAGNTRPDRKSTRLNSSHVKISYAVFCLKKK